MVIRHYLPGETVNLYKFRSHKRCQGVLYFTPKTAAAKGYLKAAAFFCLCIAVLGFASLIIPTLVLEARTSFNKAPLITGNVGVDEETKAVLPYVNDFKIVVPKIGLDSEVIPDVDPAKEDEYKEQLRHGVAHAKGSYLPGEKGGPIYLFSHSTDAIWNIETMNAKFFAVKDLGLGDEIMLHFKGKDYKYAIEDRQVTSPENLGVIQESKSDLILQTCWPPGTDWQRLLVFARLKTN